MTSDRKLSLAVMGAFGVGQAAEGIKNIALNSFLLFYYQQVLGVSGLYTGLALAIALVFDGISDPLVGSLSDKVRTRWGRRHPFMLASALPLGLTFYAIFNPPTGLSEAGLFIWLTIFTISVRACLTLYYVPHMALGAEMAQDYRQRSTLFAFSGLFSATGGAVLAYFSYRYFFPTTELFNPGLLNPDGYFGLGLAAGVGAVASIILCVFGTSGEIRYLPTPADSPPFSFRKLVNELQELFRNKSFRALFSGILLATTSVAVEAVFTPYMSVHFWELTTEQIAVIPIVFLLGLLFSVPLTPIFTHFFDKKHTLIVATLLVVANMNVLTLLRLMDVSWFPGNDSEWILRLIVARYLMLGAIAPIIFSSINSMCADIADEHELETGERREGIIFSAKSLTNKVTSAIGVVTAGAILDFIAFPVSAELGSVDTDTVWWLGFIEGPATSVFTVAGVLFYVHYQIDKERHADIMAGLTKRKKYRADA
jgi:glycoside/pentoside/hexuronide:cation symporter, GPH family